MRANFPSDEKSSKTRVISNIRISSSFSTFSPLRQFSSNWSGSQKTFQFRKFFLLISFISHTYPFGVCTRSWQIEKHQPKTLGSFILKTSEEGSDGRRIHYWYYMESGLLTILSAYRKENDKFQFYNSRMQKNSLSITLNDEWSAYIEWAAIHYSYCIIFSFPRKERKKKRIKREFAFSMNYSQ